VHAGEVRVMTGEWFPYVSKDLTNYGFAAEVVFYAFLASGIETKFVFASWDDAENQVKEGKVLATLPHKRTGAREAFAYFSEPIAMSKDVFFFMKGSLEDFQFKNLDDLKAYTLGGTRGYYYVPLFANAGVIVDYAGDASISFRKLYIGLVDLVPENEFVGWGLIQKHFPEEMYKFTATQNALSEDTLHLMVSKKFPRSSLLLEKFNRGLQEIRAKGVYQNLLKKYIKNIKIKIPHSPY
jgi:polar amino acid transport system substrate-binding protein